MKTYKARVNNIETYLQDSKQMDDFIGYGNCFIYEEENGNEKLVYYPGGGFVGDRPEFGPDKPKEETYSPELIEAVRAFLVGKEETDGGH